MGDKPHDPRAEMEVTNPHGGCFHDDETEEPNIMETITIEKQHRIAKAVQAICIEAAIRAYEDAGLSGLCQEGRWECAVDAMRGLDLPALLATYNGETHD